jgi:hypothetical protein
MRTPLRLLTLATLLVAAVAFPAAASANVAPGTYTPTAGSFNPANAPGSSHLTSGSPLCTVNSDLSINCTGYVLGGVGHTNANVSLTASYTAVIHCTNNGGNLVLAQTKTATPSSSTTVTSTKNGQLTVPPESVSPPISTLNVCPNPNWTPSIFSLTLNHFDYTLTFAGFTSPYIEITATDP